MAIDIVSDLELDQDPGTDDVDGSLTPERLDQIRTYLGTYFMVSKWVPLSPFGCLSTLRLE